MDDFSWVKPATNSLANIFGLNPEAAAQGRKMQAEQDFLAARTANTQADTGLSDYRRRVLEAQAGNYDAGASANNAQAGKYKAETEGLGITNAARRSLAEAFKAGAVVQNSDGSMTISPNAVNTIGSGLAAMDADPVKTMDGIRGLLGNAAQTPRAAAQTRGIAAAFEPNASFSAAEGEKIEGTKAAASQAEAIAVQQERNKGSLAESIAKGQTPGQPDQMDLNRQAEAIKLGAEWAMKVPFAGGYLDEGQAYQLSQAARAANPTLNPQDAITKFVRDNPGMLKSNWEMFGNNKVDIPGGVPATVPAAPVARPTAPAAAAPAPAAQAAQGMPTKAQFAALPEGGSVVVNGIKYVKQGRQLVKAQ